MDDYPNFNDVFKARMHLRDAAISHWYHHDFLTWRWWVLLFFTIAPWIIWVLFVNKERKYEILTYGFNITAVSTLLDVVGTDLVLWGYPHKLIMSVQPMFPTDYTILPIAGMCMFEHCRTWKKFFVTSVIVALLFAFVFEPILQYLQFYKLHTWKFIYSFPIYILMFNSGRWAVLKFGSKKKKDSA